MGQFSVISFEYTVRIWAFGEMAHLPYCAFATEAGKSESEVGGVGR